MTFGTGTLGAGSFGASDAGSAPPSDSITLTDITQKVFQRNGTSAAISVSGTYIGSPTAVEARVVQNGTSVEVVTWTTLDAAPAGGAFAGTITTPQGGPYNVQVRFSNDTAVVSNGSYAWNVGILALLVGQSQLVNWFDVGVHSAVTGAYRQSGSVYGGSSGTWAAMPTTGNGANEFAAQLIAQYGCPVGLLGYAVGGTLISQWDQSTDAYPRNAIKAVTDSGGAVEYVLWAQGEADGSAGTAQATYETGLTNVIANFRAQITNRSTKTNLPILVSTLGRGTAIGTDAQSSAIRAAQFAIAGSVADVYVGAETLDLPLADTVHYSSAGYVTHGKRMAQTVKYLLGDATYHRGPSIASAAVVDATTTDVTISHRGGTDFTPTSAIIGFEIDDGGSIVVPSAAVQQSATVVRLTHAALSSGSPTVRYGYGADGGDTYASTISNILVDNTALALPLEQYPQNVAISSSTSGVFVKVGGAYIPSISVHAKVAGAYKQANEIHMKQAGVYAPI